MIGATETVGLKGLLGDLDVLLVDRGTGVSVDGVLVDADVLGLVCLRDVYSGVVSRAVMLAIFTLDVVNGGAVGLTVSIDLDVSVCVLVVCRSRSMVRRPCLGIFLGFGRRSFWGNCSPWTRVRDAASPHLRPRRLGRLAWMGPMWNLGEQVLQEREQRDVV